MSRPRAERASNATRMLCAAFVLVAWSCAPTSQAQHPSPGAPHIDRIEPDSVTMPRGRVVEVVIVGKGFVPGQPGSNTIEFSGMIIPSVPSNSSGTELRLAIPSALILGGEGPPVALHPGVYDVRVKTPAGTSNAMSIWILL